DDRNISQADTSTAMATTPITVTATVNAVSRKRGPLRPRRSTRGVVAVVTSVMPPNSMTRWTRSVASGRRISSATSKAAAAAANRRPATPALTRRVAASRLEPVADAPDSHEPVGVLGSALEFLAHSPHVHGHRGGILVVGR